MWLSNGYLSPAGEHSAKPIGWQREWILRWTAPGDLVVDPYAGTGSVATACRMEGRRYLGAEIDRQRYRRAIGLIARGAR